MGEWKNRIRARKRIPRFVEGDKKKSIDRRVKVYTCEKERAVTRGSQEPADVLLTAEVWWIVAILLRCDAARPIEYVCRVQVARCSHPCVLRHALRVLRWFDLFALYVLAPFLPYPRLFLYTKKDAKKREFFGKKVVFYWNSSFSIFLSSRFIFFDSFDSWHCALWLPWLVLACSLLLFVMAIYRVKIVDVSIW